MNEDRAHVGFLAVAWPRGEELISQGAHGLKEAGPNSELRLIVPFEWMKKPLPVEIICLFLNRVDESLDEKEGTSFERDVDY